MGNKHSTGFNSHTTAEQVLEGTKTLENKTILITGGNSGIGKETARVLLNQGANVVIACRNQEKMSQAIEELVAQKPAQSNGTISGIILDLSSLESVERCATEFKTRFNKLHVLILNAGVVVPNRRLTKDGFEMTIGTNHFGHFALTMQLLDIMKQTTETDMVEGRIVVVSSDAMAFGKMKLDDLNFEKRRFSQWKSYGQSKLANYMMSKELNRRLKDSGINITSNALMPGVIKTNIGSESKSMKLTWALQKPICRSVERGAATTVLCAVHECVNGKGGLYFGNCNEHIPRFQKQIHNEEMTRQLFSLSEQMTGKPYPY